jgi:hypothetical protein
MTTKTDSEIRLAPWVRASFGVIVLYAVLSLATPAAAQIINTLRGFGDEEGWAGRVEALLAAADGSADYFEFDLGAAVQYRAGRNRVRLLAQRMRRESRGEKIADNTLGHLRHNYDLSGPLATVAFVQGQQNPFRRIEERFLAGAGLRVDVIERDHVDMLIGAVYMREHEQITSVPADSVVNRNRASVYASILGKPRESVQLDLAAFYQPVIGEIDDQRAFVAAAVRVDIVGGLYFTFAYTLVHDSLPPPGVPETDQYLRSGLGFQF